MNRFTADETILHFEEGLIGLPALRSAALVKLPDFEPFRWLASLSDPNVRFLVVEPTEIFPNFVADVPSEIAAGLDLNEEKPLVLTLVTISSDWQKTRVNLRAPIFVNAATRRAAQAVLTASDYGVAEFLPGHLTVAQAA